MQHVSTATILRRLILVNILMVASIFGLAACSSAPVFEPAVSRGPAGGYSPGYVVEPSSEPGVFVSMFVTDSSKAATFAPAFATIAAHQYCSTQGGVPAVSDIDRLFPKDNQEPERMKKYSHHAVGFFCLQRYRYLAGVAQLSAVPETVAPHGVLIENVDQKVQPQIKKGDVLVQIGGSKVTVPAGIPGINEKFSKLRVPAKVLRKKKQIAVSLNLVDRTAEIQAKSNLEFQSACRSLPSRSRPSLCGAL